MEGDRERRTSSGNTLRLVGSGQGADGRTEPSGRQERAAQTPAEHDGVAGSGGALDGTGPAPSVESDVVQASTVLPGQRASVAVGRHWVVRNAVENDVTGMANQVLELLSSELLANAMLHGPEGGAVGLQVRHTRQTVRVSVSDGGVEPPVVLHREPTAPSGRGMAIIEAMSSRWGVEEHRDGGKTVWFELDLEDF